MAKRKSPAAPATVIDLRTKLTRIVHSLERARDASMPLLGLLSLHEKLVDITNDEANGDVLNWYAGYHSGSVQEATKSLAQVIDDSLNDLENTVRPMLAEVSHD